MSAYADTIAWLYHLDAARGMDFKLERVTLALAALGNPQRRYPCLHIAGTNGKGSVAAMLHAMLLAAGRRVGLYTSPHLIRFTERIRIGREEITEDEVVELTREIHTAATSRGIDLTFFEFVTVLAFLAFARHGVDSAVIEVGLGGRLDATNVIDPEVAIVTTIGRDHEQYLGDTLESIAAEKGGIIKPDRPVILGRMPAVATRVLRAIAAERGAPIVEVPEEIRVTHDPALHFRGLGWDLANVVLALRGGFQIDNAATALAGAALVRERLGIPEAAVREGLSTVQWPGRLEILSTAPLVILDGAHNEEGIRTLCSELPAIIGTRALHLLFGVMHDKRWQPMVELLAPLMRSATITTVPPRGEDPVRIAQAFRGHCPVDVAADSRSAVVKLLARLPADAALLVTGSLFLVGEVYATLQQAGRRDGVAAQP